MTEAGTELARTEGGGYPAGGYPVAPAITAEALKEEWLNGRKPTTRRAYAKDLEHFLAFARVKLHGVDATPDWFFRLGPAAANGLTLAYKNDQLARGLASATIARRLAAVRSLTKLARTLGLIAWDVTTAAPPPEERRDMSGPTDKDLAKLNRASKAGDGPTARRDRAMFALLAGLGLRRAEVAALDLADVDFPRARVMVLGKGKREKVAIDLPDEVFAALSAWASVRGGAGGPFFHRTDRAAPAGSAPARLSGESIRLAVGRLAKEAKVGTPVRPHGLRHSYATRMAAVGETIQAIAAGMRHSKIETTNRYLDTKKADARRLNARASKALK